MMEWLEHIVFWHWWILAGVLLILELTAPAFFFLWLGIAAAAVGLIMLVFPAIGVETQLVLFAIASIVSVIAWRKYRESRPIVTDQPNLNRLIAVILRGFPLHHQAWTGCHDRYRDGQAILCEDLCHSYFLT